MPDELTNQFIAELAKQLPVKQAYQDVASPAAIESGKILSDAAKVIHLALAPVQLLAALQDRLSCFLDRSVRRIPEESRIAPAPQILGPIIEAIRFEPDGQPIDEMFSQLMSRSMDKNRCNEAHPAYVHIIKQLSADEAVIIFNLREKPIKTIVRAQYDHRNNCFSEGEVVRQDFKTSLLIFEDELMVYIEHLKCLGIVETYSYSDSKPIFDDTTKDQTGLTTFLGYRLSRWGHSFAKACVSSPQ